MDNLKSTSQLVKMVLQSYPETRSSDNLLYYQILKILGQDNGIDIDSMSVTRFLLYMKQYGFPQFESVRRTRQKIQQHHPELSPNDKVEGFRTLNEKDFRYYARKVDV